MQISSIIRSYVWIVRFPGQFGSDLRQLVVGMLFDARNLITACNPTTEHYMSAVAMFRGQISADVIIIGTSTNLVSQQVRSYLSSARNMPHLEQVLNNIKIDSCKLGADGSVISAAFLGNTTAIKDIFDVRKTLFITMFRRKAFVHWYTSKGMDEAQFEMRDLISEYMSRDEWCGSKRDLDFNYIFVETQYDKVEESQCTLTNNTTDTDN
uniref:Tubulin_C domain-containing protein n=1 Tax=Wuchereria bancrofti TaxID=6293 RepID=A0AAF5PIK8_WUCBA